MRAKIILAMVVGINLISPLKRMMKRNSKRTNKPMIIMVFAVVVVLSLFILCAIHYGVDYSLS